MIDRTTKLRWRRNIRQSRRQVEDLGAQAEEQLERHFFRRVGRLLDVRRFVISWVMLVIFLIGGVVFQTRALGGFYKSLKPVAGGSYTEGIVGSFTDANPLYATGLVDSTVSRLLFSSLFKIDQNGTLVGDLALKWGVDVKGVQYTVTLRDGLTWHDGKPLTANDVVFTYHAIQNADAKSPLFGSWQGIKVEAPNKGTVIFTLPNVLSAFPYSMTNGIVPEHLLGTVPPTQLRSVRFNTASPVGSGPFMWNRVEVSGTSPEEREEKVGLTAFPKYHEGAPKLDNFVVRSFHDEKHMIESFQREELDGMVGLNSTPSELQKRDKLTEYNVPLAGEVAVFLKNSNEVLKDVKVRQAIVRSVKQPEVIKSLGYPAVTANSPLLRSQPGYDKSLTQLPYDVKAANSLLDSAGWVREGTGIRHKDKKPLSFNLYAQNSDEYMKVTQVLQKQWRSVGIDAHVQLQPGSDLQGVVSRHDYDALLYGVSLGPDPDVFAYWHSSQADPRSASRLNLSEYKSATADKSLEAGRTRSDAAIRAIKYKPFLQSWRDDAPAAVLYQPRFLYVTRSQVFGFKPKTFNEASDRISNVSEWMIRKQKTVD